MQKTLKMKSVVLILYHCIILSKYVSEVIGKG